MNITRILSSLVVIGVVGAAGISASQAFFTDTEVSTENTITTGNLQLDVNNNGSTGTFPLALGTVALMPGEVTPPVSIEIRNTGTSDLAWFGYFDIDAVQQGLDKAVYIDSAKMEFLPSPGWETTPGYELVDPFITDGKGSGPYPSAYNALAAADPFTVISMRSFTTSPLSNVMGTGPGVFMGALKPYPVYGKSYKLTFTLGMAEDAGNSYQGGSFDLGFVVKATQVDADAINQLSTSDSVVEFAPANADAHVTWFNAQLDKQD